MASIFNQFPFLPYACDSRVSTLQSSVVVLLCCLFARSSICPDRSLILPVSCGFEYGGRDDTEEQYSVLLRKDYPVPCTVCVRWTRVRRPGEFTSRESCDCACVLVGLYCPWYCPLPTVSPVCSVGECESLSQPTLP